MSKGRPSLLKTLANFLIFIAVVLSVRWIGFELYMIPSGSMYPHLFIRDYVIASKADFGLRIPFTQHWLLGPYGPERGNVIIFRNLDDSKFYVKRVIGLPGDKVVLEGDLVKSINDVPAEHRFYNDIENRDLAEKIGFSTRAFRAFDEKLPEMTESIVALTTPMEIPLQEESFQVPDNMLLVMGDHRHRSMDGRYFGYLPLKNLVARARFIVWSCEGVVQGTNMCDVNTLRFGRFGKSVAR